MPIEYGPKQFAEMTALERKLDEVLDRAKGEQLAAHLALFALIRKARPLLELHNTSAQTDLLNLIIAFLRRDEVTLEGEPTRLIQLH